MSLLNAAIRPSYAVIAVDTQGLASGEKSIVVSKLSTLVHINTVLAFRGVSAVFSTLQMLTHITDNADIEALLKNLEEALPGAVAMAEGCLKAAAAATNGIAQSVACPHELAAIGWSAKRSEMVGVVFRSDAQGQNWTRDEFDQLVTGPEVEAFPNTDAEHLALARQQCAMHDEIGEGGMAGGNLLLAHVTRGSISITDLGALR